MALTKEKKAELVKLYSKNAKILVLFSSSRFNHRTNQSFNSSLKRIQNAASKRGLWFLSVTVVIY